MGPQGSSRTSPRWSSALVFGPALAWLGFAAAGLVWTSTDSSAWAEVERHGDPVAGSESCRACHPSQWESWHHSWHRTMTQRVSPGGALEVAAHSQGQARSEAPAEGQVQQAGVLAPFAGEQLEYGGFRATMSRDADGRPRVRVERVELEGEGMGGEGQGATVLDVEVALSVGSHRYQQYLAYIDRGGGAGELWRLPLAWHRQEARWIHMNGAFVEPEGEPGSLADYERHLSRWNDNCIFCHNTEVAPGLEHGAQGPEFRSRVGELGISCEACHGPASAHVARHRGNPLRRLLALDRSRGDSSITHPARLDPARSSEVCGRCHGQRIARDIAAVMRSGDGFVAGDELAGVSRPIFADSVIAGSEQLGEGRPFASRFWPDGTPRLSAYEYQGLLSSPCWDEGEGLGCEHCHDMHGDAPDGQLRAGMQGDASCRSCHGSDELSVGHGGHGQAVDCLGCHMPRTSYGLLEGMISHRITSPDPGAWIGRDDQPDACTQCHVERSRAWAADAMQGLGLAGTPVSQPPERETLGSRVALDLLGGDAIQRNLAADALAQPGAQGGLELRMAWLGAALEDEYPSVRWFAWRGLRSLVATLPAGTRRSALEAALARFDYLAAIEARVELVAQIRAQLEPGPLAAHPELRDELFDQRQAAAIWIGE